MLPSLNGWLSIWPQSAAHLDRALELGLRLRLPLQPIDCDPKRLDPEQALLCVGASGLAVQHAGRKAPGPVRVDFLGGTVAHRRLFGGGAGQQIAKAIGIKQGIRPQVADLTAGLGRDSFVLATLGCRVQLVERAPVVGLLLEDGLERAKFDPEVGPIITDMSLHQGDALAWLSAVQTAPEVIYLDPMFPHSEKSAQVKKEMLLFRDLVGADADASVLLETALQSVQYRVVVKRPRKAPTLNDRKPSFSLDGKSGRFDVYSIKALR
ncbi:MAG: 16S rRNA (guanine1516-N2)-methyltransferase [Motiliproteus sp.]|jgi:16S rRNA (guanine1516-N2)-methyltransferase